MDQCPPKTFHSLCRVAGGSDDNKEKAFTNDLLKIEIASWKVRVHDFYLRVEEYRENEQVIAPNE